MGLGLSWEWGELGGTVEWAWGGGGDGHLSATACWGGLVLGRVPNCLEILELKRYTKPSNAGKLLQTDETTQAVF